MINKRDESGLSRRWRRWRLLAYKIAMRVSHRFITAIEYGKKNNGFGENTGENTKEVHTTMAAFVTVRMRAIS